MEHQTLQWGIMGCAGIARKNIRAILLSKGNTVRAVASRFLEKSKQFIVENNLSKDSTVAYGSYEELLGDATVQAVYIPLPTTLHLEWVIKTAKAKKHILLEKPTALDTDALKVMIDVCAENGVFLMDGVMFMHHPRTKLLRSILADPFSCKVMRVNSSFSFKGDASFLNNDIRCKINGDPLGALGDLSWYNIRLGIVAFANGQDLAAYGQSEMLKSKSVFYPIRCSARCNVWNDEGVPIDVEGVVWFGSNGSKDDEIDATRYLRFDSSFVVPFRQSFEISVSSPVVGVGDKVIRCNDFVLSQTNLTGKLSIETQPSSGPFGNQATAMTFASDDMNISGCQEAEMFTNFAAYIRHREAGAELGDLPSEEYWKQMSLWTQATIDACYKSMKAEGAIVDIKV